MSRARKINKMNLVSTSSKTILSLSPSLSGALPRGEWKLFFPSLNVPKSFSIHRRQCHKEMFRLRFQFVEYEIKSFLMSWLSELSSELKSDKVIGRLVQRYRNARCFCVACTDVFDINFLFNYRVNALSIKPKALHNSKTVQFVVSVFVECEQWRKIRQQINQNYSDFDKDYCIATQRHQVRKFIADKQR